MTVNDGETEQYSGVVVFLKFAYLCMIYVTRMNICNIFIINAQVLLK